MDVHVPQAGDEELARAVDDCGVLWGMRLLPRSYRNDAIALNDHCHIRLRRPTRGVDHSDMFYHERLGPAANTAQSSKQENEGQAETQPIRREPRNQNSSHFNFIRAGQYANVLASRQFILRSSPRTAQ